MLNINALARWIASSVRICVGKASAARASTARFSRIMALNDQVFLKRVSFSEGREKWPSGAPRLNHAKFWMMDDKLFYVGSENLYPSLVRVLGTDLHGSLQEFGVIVEAPPAVRDMILGTYFKPLFEHGVRTEATPSDLRW